MTDLDRLTARFEIAVGNFVRSCFDRSANEKAFQAWYAASVIQEFGLSRVYREIHLSKAQLTRLVGAEAMAGFERGNELFPDLSVSWEEAIDARHTQARSASLDAAGMLAQLGIVSELKVTSSTARPTLPRAIRQDLRKLGVFALAHRLGGAERPLGVYLVILDNHRRSGGEPSSHYRVDRVEALLGQVMRDWPGEVPRPNVLVGGIVDGVVGVTRY